jgi:hypothetical protein
VTNIAIYDRAPPERQELKRRPRSRSLAVESVRRAKVILMLAAGDSYSEICERIGCSDRYVSLWKDRFQRERLSGLDSRYRGAEHRRRTAETEARILELTRRGPTELRELGAQAVMDDLSLFTGTPANCDEVIWKESV